VDVDLTLMALAGSDLVQWARAQGLRVVREAFADRAYTPQGTLASRNTAGAVLHDADEIAARMLRLVQDGALPATDGSLIAIEAESICVHGDSPDAVRIAQRLHQHLRQSGVDVCAFAA